MNLADIIRRALDESDSPDPYEVAVLVDQMIGSREVREALRMLLPDAVREVIRSRRSGFFTDEPVVAGSGVNGKRGLGEMTNTPDRHQMFVPGSGWKFEVDLTAEDCDAIADEYLSRARSNEAQAGKWRERARRLRESGRSTLGEFSVAAAA
jgi:hypothetical protein